MKCYQHSEVSAYEQCHTCSHPICDDCVSFGVQGQHFCKEHHRTYVQKMQRRYIGTLHMMVILAVLLPCLPLYTFLLRIPILSVTRFGALALITTILALMGLTYLTFSSAHNTMGTLQTVDEDEEGRQEISFFMLMHLHSLIFAQLYILLGIALLFAQCCGMLDAFPFFTQPAIYVGSFLLGSGTTKLLQTLA